MFYITCSLIQIELISNTCRYPHALRCMFVSDLSHTPFSCESKATEAAWLRYAVRGERRSAQNEWGSGSEEIADKEGEGLNHTR